MLSYPIPIFHQHFDLNKTSTPLILPFYASASAFSGFISFPTESGPHGESLQPLSCQHLQFPRPFASATYPLPISNSRFLQQSVFSMPTPRLPSTAGENHTALQTGATADLCFLITAEFSTPFLNLS